ncbi:MAG: hypothetical protein K9W44_03975 [Candidatus Lokiarchaeota archaeon]|nr:hypothetical protein [Candidatus Harpocratesius repetitus]
MTIDFPKTDYDPITNVEYKFCESEIKRLIFWPISGLPFVNDRPKITALFIYNAYLSRSNQFEVSKSMLYDIVLFGWYQAIFNRFLEEDWDIFLKLLDVIDIENHIRIAGKVKAIPIIE